MSFLKLFLLTLLVASPLSYARSPAVEPGVIMDSQFPVIPPAMSPSINLHMTIQPGTEEEAYPQAEGPWDASVATVFLLFVGIPMLWTLIIGRLAVTYQTLEAKHSNVIPLRTKEKEETKKAA